jgi:hypothetical protein
MRSFLPKAERFPEPPEADQYVPIQGTADPEAPHVQSPLEDFDQEIQALERAVDILLAEIKPFLNPHQITCKSASLDAVKKESDHSPFVSHLRSKLYALSNIRRKVQTATDQLDF